MTECPYGVRSVMECVSRAIHLSQPTDIPDFISQYLSDMISFRNSHPEADSKIVAFQYQELWEKTFIRNREGTTETLSSTTETSATSPQPPSQAEVDKAMKPMYSDLARSFEKYGVTRQNERLNKPSGKDKTLAETPIYPAPPPRAGRRFRKNETPPSLVIKDDCAPVPSPRDVSVKTRKVSSLRFPNQQLSKATTDDVKTMPKRRPLVLAPITNNSTSLDASVSKSSAATKLSKPPSIAALITAQKLVLPPIPQKKTRKVSPMNRQVVPEKNTSIFPARRALGPIKEKTKPKTVLGPKSTEEPWELETKSTSAGHTTPTVQKREKNWNRLDKSPEATTRGKRVLWIDRERVKPVLNRPVEGLGAQGRNNFNLAPVSSPYLAHAIYVIKYKRVLVRSSALGHNGPSVSSRHHYGT